MIGTIGIITADRPRMLRRSLSLCLEQLQLYGHRPRLLVVDGSRRSLNRRSNAHVIAVLSERHGRPVTYIGAEEAATVRRSLCEGFGHDVVSFGLTPGAIGSNRNILLLLTAGSHLLMLDDDMLPAGWQPADTRGGVLITGHEDVRLSAFFTSRQQAVAAATRGRRPVDVVETHGAILGTSLNRVDASHVDASRICTHIAGALESGRDVRIRLTFSGLAGDSGVFCQYRQLVLPGSTQRVLMSNPAVLGRALTSREVHRCAPAVVATHDPGCMAACMGVANTDLVTPFLPFGRSEDGVFGAMVAFLRPDALFGHLPHLVVHDSERPSAYEPGLMPSASGTRLADVMLAAIVDAAAEVGSGPGGRHDALVGKLAELAGIDDLMFARWFEQRYRERLSVQCAHLEMLADEGSSEWRSAVARYRGRLISSMGAGRFFVPMEFGAASAPREAFAAARATLLRFSALLRAWPSMMQAAEDTLASWGPSGPASASAQRR